MQVAPIPHLVTLPHKVIRILALTATNITLIEKFDYGVFFYLNWEENSPKKTENHNSSYKMTNFWKKMVINAPSQ